MVPTYMCLHTDRHGARPCTGMAHWILTMNLKAGRSFLGICGKKMDPHG
jgi:hypothetical protein